MKQLIMALALFIVFPVSQVHSQQFDPYHAVGEMDKELATRIAELDKNVRYAFEMMPPALASIGVSEELFKRVMRYVAVADYYMAKSWAEMVEGKLDAATKNVELGEKAIEDAGKAIQAQAL